MYQYQETQHPYGSGPIPDHEWITISRHRTIKRAALAYVKGGRAMRRRTGNPYSWDCNRRVIDADGNIVGYCGLYPELYH